jgi:hypothetical protein
MRLDALTSVALTTMVALAMSELHLEVVAGAGAFLGAWWMLRDPADAPR